MLVTNKNWQADLHKKNYKTLNTSNASGKKSEANEIIKKTSFLGPKYLFLDGERFRKKFINFITAKKIKVIKIDDNYKANKIKTWAVINPNVYSKKKYYKKQNFKIILAGKKYILLRHEFQKKIKKKNEKRIFISLGVSAVKKLKTNLKNSLKKLGLEIQIAEKYNSNEMIKAIDNASAVICGASVTLHEVWARKRTAVPVYQAKDQARFYKWCKKHFIPVVSSKNKKPFVTARLITLAVKKIIRKKSSHIPQISPNGADVVINKLFFSPGFHKP